MLIGSERYCSLNAITGGEQSRRDDLESAGYVMIYLARKNYLPWKTLNMDNKKERINYILNIKRKTNVEKLCHNLPKAFCDYMKYVKNLKFEEEPNYNYLRGLFIDLLTSLKMKNDLEFSWISKNKKKKKEISVVKKRSLFKKKEGPQSRLFKKLVSSEKERKLNNSENKVNKINNFIIKNKNVKN